jgi:hypothetical protein
MASPVLTMMDPDDPLVTAPELKLRVPLAPFEPASNVRITNDPLLDIMPLPEYNVTEPPVPASEALASTSTLPPAPLLPLHSVRTIGALRAVPGVQRQRAARFRARRARQHLRVAAVAVVAAAHRQVQHAAIAVQWPRPCRP